MRKGRHKVALDKLYLNIHTFQEPHVRVQDHPNQHVAPFMLHLNIRHEITRFRLIPPDAVHIQPAREKQVLNLIQGPHSLNYEGASICWSAWWEWW
jgi:hypothetical protein